MIQKPCGLNTLAGVNISLTQLQQKLRFSHSTKVNLLGFVLYLAEVFLDAFLAESCSPSLSSLLLSFRSSSSILRYTVKQKARLGYFSTHQTFVLVSCSLMSESTLGKLQTWAYHDKGKMKDLRGLVIASFGLVAAGALGRTASL